MEKTEWFPGNVKPAREGWYEVDRPRFSNIPHRHMLQWNGYAWEYAYDLGYARAGMFAEMYTGDSWRGLTEPTE